MHDSIIDKSYNNHYTSLFGDILNNEKIKKNLIKE